MRVLSKKQTSIFYLGQKASHKKTTGLPSGSIFKNLSKFSIGPSLKIYLKKSLSRHHKQLGANIHHIVVAY
jgi:hypothetical protein